jgi:Ni/Fe-hydrogenase subunit HybB-like protein
MKDTHEIKMMTPFTEVLLVVMALGLGVAIYRLINGLGATTNLSDNFPWGLWIGFDLLGGVAMAAGGFIIAGTVYLLHWEKYRPIVRPAVLTAFLGYLLAVVALFFDLGQPFRIWHPAFMWQYHSVMWVVAMHVIFYTLTLGVEFSPMLFEKLKLTGLLRFVKKIMVGVVLFGVMLSVLHQSSLGALYLIMVNKLSPLWYNPLIPYFFLVSAVAMGLNMVSLESIISAKAFKHAPHMDILQGLARGSIIALVLYLAMKVIYLINGAGLAAIFDGSMEANIYLLEMIGGVLIPIILLVATNVRQSTGGLLFVNILVIGGVLLNRMSIAVFGMYEYSRAQGGSYTPSLMEFTLTLAIVAFGIFLFKVVAKYLTLFPEAEMQI